MLDNSVWARTFVNERCPDYLDCSPAGYQPDRRRRSRETASRYHHPEPSLESAARSMNKITAISPIQHQKRQTAAGGQTIDGREEKPQSPGHDPSKIKRVSGTLRGLRAKATLVNSQSADLRFERRTRDAESCGRAGGPEHAPASRAQGFLDNRLLVRRHCA